jgi:hypothetical protein
MGAKFSLALDAELRGHEVPETCRVGNAHLPQIDFISWWAVPTLHFPL